MADRSHLTAVPTTDKRGRATTVYRNLGRGNGAPGASAIPSVPSVAPRGASAVGPTGTPLRRPDPIPRELREPLADVIVSLDSYLGPDLTAKLTDTEDGPVAMAYAAWLNTNRTLPDGTPLFLLAKATDSTDATRALDALRVTAHLWDRWGDAIGEDAPGWSLDVLDNLSGHQLAYPGPITTEEQLDAATAVVDFQLRARRIDRDLITHTEYANGHMRSLANPHLHQLLCERPEDLDRIVAFVRERGMSASDTTEDLRKWLDEGTAPAVAGGWL